MVNGTKYALNGSFNQGKHPDFPTNSQFLFGRPDNPGSSCLNVWFRTVQLSHIKLI